ncbi:hypothetical protein JOF53_001992 [Crossiella equi]|uniref:Uncharacterized protein n=1 Tax=Crossiella equi TaxID=130796 RepID=A0ABS5A982_9PSEU|nr:hypothetical protein [Crossiella equi]MBP2473120.1 hypothetical protein [Crossiella equi]
MAVRFEAGEQEELSSLLGECLRVDNQYVSVVGDHVVCGLPPGNDPPEVLRSRMDSLAKMSKYRALVGIAFADEDLARSLASSDFSSRVLDAAREKKIVVTVSDELYHQVVIGSLPHDRRSYRRNEDEFGGWVRVPGYSMPPEPAVDKPTDHQRTEADPGRGPTVIVQGRARIGKQFNASVINYGGVRSDGR